MIQIILALGVCIFSSTVGFIGIIYPNTFSPLFWFPLSALFALAAVIDFKKYKSL